MLSAFIRAMSSALRRRRRSHFRDVAGTVVAARSEILLRAADILTRETAEIRDVLIEESGSTFGKSMFELAYCVDLLRSAAAECRSAFGETFPQLTPGQIGMTVCQHLGVIVCIAPFNAPFLLAMQKVVFAVASCNCFVLKPSEETR